MFPPLAKRGRVIVPDLIGFGRSDKPTLPNAYSIKAHVRWLRAFVLALDPHNVTLVCQDWGGSLGLRGLADLPPRVARLGATNTGISAGRKRSEAVFQWRRASPPAPAPA